MITNAPRLRTIVAFAGDVWEHACPILRLVEPARLAGLTLLRGNDWQDGVERSFPERIAEADLVVIQRDFPRNAEAYRAVVERAREQGKPLVYELDDLLTEVPPDHPDATRYREAAPAMLQAALEADGVVAATPGLVEYLRTLNPYVWLLPNYLNGDLWPTADPGEPETGAADRAIVIGYMGGHSHVHDLEMIAPALIRVLEKHGERVTLKFWGIGPPAALASFPNVLTMPGAHSDYAEFAAYFRQQQCDIFIAPLRDNLFNRCKSHVKFLEYSSLGVPGVYSASPAYQRVVIPESNGLVAASLAEWEAGLARLIADPALRRRLGGDARRTVREHWLLSEHVGGWLETYQEIAAVAAGNQQLTGGVSALRRMRERQRALEQQLSEQAQAARQQQEQAAERERALREQLLRAAEREQQLAAQLAGAQHEAHSLKNRLSAADRELRALTAQHAEVTGSLGWQGIQAQRRLRLRLVPSGSGRERLMNSVLEAAMRWRTAGAWGALRPGQGRARSAAGAQPLLQISAEPGDLCPTPAISVVIPLDGFDSNLEEQAAREWLAGQTCPGIEAVAWSPAAGRAWRLDSPDAPWSAPNLAALQRGLKGRYVCLASADLLDQPAVYLEANLIALETEALAFTVNVRGHGDWALPLLAEGRLPGNPALPLLRQVARLDCVADDFSLDLSGWLAEREANPAVAGKALCHTTTAADDLGSLPFEARLANLEVRLDDRRLVVRAASEDAWPTVQHATYPLDTVAPMHPVPSSCPTVIVALQMLAVGGAERVALDVMRRLTAGVRFVVVTTDRAEADVGTTADQFREVTPYVYTVPDYLGQHLTSSLFDYLIGRFEPKTLYIANGSAWLYDALYSLKARYPDLRTVNQVYDHQAGWINRYEAGLVASLDAHIGVNSQICQAYRAHGARPERVFEIAHGVDTEEYDPARYSAEQLRRIRQDFGLPPGQKVVTFMGRLHPQKRPMDFVEMARRFASDPAITFLLVGDGPLTRVVGSQINQIGLRNVIRRPFHHPSRDVLAVSDVVVSASEYEGMPLVLLEAQAMGKPVVATDVGNNREVLEKTGGGVVVPRIGDVGALRDGVLRVLNAPPDPTRLRQSILPIVNLDSIAETYRRVLLGNGDA